MNADRRRPGGRAARASPQPFSTAWKTPSSEVEHGGKIEPGVRWPWGCRLQDRAEDGRGLSA